MNVCLAGGNGNVHYFKQSPQPPPLQKKKKIQPKNKTKIAMIIEMTVIAGAVKCQSIYQMHINYVKRAIESA